MASPRASEMPSSAGSGRDVLHIERGLRSRPNAPWARASTAGLPLGPAGNGAPSAAQSAAHPRRSLRAPCAVAPPTLHNVTTNGTNWHPRDLRDERLAAALAGGATYCDAAASSGYSLRTAKRRGVDPDFAERVARRLGELADRACDTLGDLLSPAEPAPTRHAAARTILDAGAKLREQAELVDRIEALEARRPDPHLRSVS